MLGMFLGDSGSAIRACLEEEEAAVLWGILIDREKGKIKLKGQQNNHS